MTFGSLFAGIGGFDLGFERAGMQCKWQVEIDPYAQKVLAKHWPEVRRWDDVRTFPPANCGGCGATDEQDRCIGCRADFYADWRVDVICGGFPCQDISCAGRGAGLRGERSGLFFEAMRVIRELGPRFIVLENVAGLLTRGIDEVLGTLASFGLDAEWKVLSASEFGAPHRRERVFILAYSSGIGLEAKPNEALLCGQAAHSRNVGHFGPMGGKEFWVTPRPIGAIPMGMGDGVPGWLDRIKGCGNAVVPQVAEYIGRRIVEAAGESPP